MKNVTTVGKPMGTLWNCTVLTNKGLVASILPVVQFKGEKYTAAYCFKKIHVRQEKSPQTILVNNAVLEPVRTDLSEPSFDFVADYQYAENELVNVTCANFLNTALLTMEYAMADKFSDKFQSADLKSYRGIGFIAKLHSGHNNTSMICTNVESTDYTKVMVRFNMRAFHNNIKIKINGMIVKQKLEHKNHNFYVIDYKYISNQLTYVSCEVERSDLDELHIEEKAFGSNKAVVLIPKEKEKISVCTKPDAADEFSCAADDISGNETEIVEIRFSEGDKLIDLYQLHMQLPSNGTVMEVYSNDNLKVIFYEFEVGETLMLKCNHIFPHDMLGSVLYLKFKDFDMKKKDGAISQTFNLTRQHENAVVACYLKKEARYMDEVVREIRVILREKDLTTTTAPTSTGPVTEKPVFVEVKCTCYTYAYALSAVGIITLAALIIFLAKKRC